MDTPANWTWRAEEVAAGDAILVDIDGVISDAWHRQHHLDGARKDWDRFFGEVHADPPIDSLIALLAIVDSRVSVLLLTARPHWTHEMTVEWLHANDVRWDLLVMRAASDDRLASGEFKRRSVRGLREYGFRLAVSLEDDPRNVEMFNEEEVPCIYIHSGYYE